MRDAINKFNAEASQVVESFLVKLESYKAPPVVYHYTTDAGLRGILQSGRIWLTDIFSLNDPSELRHGLSRAQAILNQKAASGPPESKMFAKDFASLDKGLDRAAHYFVCSFSEAGDDLGQWRAYADNGRGYALGFDAKALEEAFGKGAETPTSNNAAFPVTYGDSTLDDIQRQLIEKMFGLISLPHGRKLPGDVIVAYMAELLRKLHVVSVPMVGADGKPLLDKKKKPLEQNVVVGLESQLRDEARVALADARKKKGGLSVRQFMSGYGAQRVNDPEALWDSALLAGISSSLTTTLMWILLLAVMTLFLSAFVIDAAGR